MTMTRRDMMGILGSTAAALALPATLRAQASAKPNVLFIIVDDLAYKTLGCTGATWMNTPNIDRLRREGVLFRNAFVTNSLCSPSRTSFLTGTHSRKHGVIENGTGKCVPDYTKTPHYPMRLQTAGYKTGFIGKYHCDYTSASQPPRPGFDYWLSFAGQGSYGDMSVNINGTVTSVTGYSTTYLTDYALRFIEQNKNGPWSLYLSYKAAHGPFSPETKYDGTLTNMNRPEPANYRDTFATKPYYLRRLKSMTNAFTQAPTATDVVKDSVTPPAWDPQRDQSYFETIPTLDDSVGRLLTKLENIGQLDNTIIFFVGDNGFFLGEHKLGDKRLMYEESIRVPMILRYPAVVGQNTTNDKMVLNTDVAPTILDLCGVAIPTVMDGMSMRPILSNQSSAWRTEFLYDYGVDSYLPYCPKITGIRTQDWKLITYPDIDTMYPYSTNINELYDLKNDPHELTNLWENPAYAAKVTELTTRMNALIDDEHFRTPGRTATLPSSEHKSRSFALSVSAANGVLHVTTTYQGHAKISVYGANGRCIASMQGVVDRTVQLRIPATFRGQALIRLETTTGRFCERQIIL